LGRVHKVERGKVIEVNEMRCREVGPVDHIPYEFARYSVFIRIGPVVVTSLSGGQVTIFIVNIKTISKSNVLGGRQSMAD
jgi:hypothetical protein